MFLQGEKLIVSFYKISSKKVNLIVSKRVVMFQEVSLSFRVFSFFELGFQIGLRYL